MGRTITYDSLVQERINNILAERTIHTGLIIGQVTLQKDIVIRLCSTPSKDDDLDININESDDAVKPGNKKSNKEILDLDEQWICQHAKQVTRALPGGLDVLGFYVAASSEYASQNQDQLRQILFAIYKTISRSQKFELPVTERVLLNICTETYKFICRTYDIADYKNSANPAEWKNISGIPRWHKIQCDLAVDMKFSIKTEEAGSSLQKQIENGLQPFFTSITKAHALINDIPREPGELLNATHDGRKMKQTSQLPQQCYTVKLFLPLEQNNNLSKPEVSDCICMMTFKGVVHCRAYVHGKATVKEGIDALKQDITRSVTARCEIHCEDLLLIDEEQQDPLVIHELPRRVFANLPQDDLCVCDYQFHGDTASDSLDAFKELLDLDLTEQDVDMTCEISPTTSTLILPEVMEDRLSEFGDTPASNRNPLLVPMAGAAIAAVAAGVSYFMLLGSEGT